MSAKITAAISQAVIGAGPRRMNQARSAGRPVRPGGPAADTQEGRTWLAQQAVFNLEPRDLKGRNSAGVTFNLRDFGVKLLNTDYDKRDDTIYLDVKLEDCTGTIQVKQGPKQSLEDLTKQDSTLTYTFEWDNGKLELVEVK
ncbi:hypothetical protein [Yersinia ruckeri]|uniref:hypothetical protein n=1 Tax=Yersinia ruckeri TaxID=29486 RepID=UPI002238E3CB|nr:hypothetical protein [Yersinia ruckeri]MCW6598736.1 hypothetical protein [Yersinia ruckeri]